MKRQKIKIELIETNEGQILGVPSNPRYIKGEEFEKLKKSIVDFPEMLTIREVVVFPLNGRFIALGGNMRFLACKELSYKEIDCVILPAEMPAEKLKEFAIKDNGNFGAWDFELLANEWDLELLDMANVTIPNFELPEETPEATEDDYEVPAEIKTNIVKGDLFEIGNHRLICGDSTDSEQVAKLMNGEKADMVFTDPPYGMFLDTDNSKRKSGLNKAIPKNYDKIIGDNTDFTPKLINTTLKYFSETKEIFMWCADYYIDLLPNFGKDGAWLVWDKRVEDNMDGRIGSNFELCWTKQKHQRLLCRERWLGAMGTEKQDIQKRIHPSQKPLGVCSFVFNKWGRLNDLIVDLFLGSGTTMVAAHQLQRKCYGMELSEKYCQVIIERMLKLDPTLTVKRNGVVTNEFH